MSFSYPSALSFDIMLFVKARLAVLELKQEKSSVHFKAFIPYSIKFFGPVVFSVLIP